MVIHEAVRALLIADSTISGIVSTGIYPLIAPQGSSLPCIVYQRISGPRISAHDGPSGLARPRYQYTCIAATYAAAKALANAVREVLDGYSGTTNGVQIETILIENEMDVYNFETDERASSYSVIIDCVIWHLET